LIATAKEDRDLRKLFPIHLSQFIAEIQNWVSVHLSERVSGRLSGDCGPFRLLFGTAHDSRDDRCRDEAHHTEHPKVG